MHTTTAHPLDATTVRRISATPALAGIAYSLLWVVGLAIWPTNLDVSSSGRAVIAANAAHPLQATLQYLMVEGFAALALGTVVLALGRAARQRDLVPVGRFVVGFGLTATAISLLQTILGVALVNWFTPAGDASQVATVFGLLNRLDGVKMFALALMALGGVVMARRGALPRWLVYAGVLLALALLASGLGYLFLNSTLALAAAVSLPLLLIWVTGAGVALGWSKRYQLARA